jgi:hypothetical protein
MDSLKHRVKTQKTGNMLIFEQKAAMPKRSHNTICCAKIIYDIGVDFYIIRAASTFGMTKLLVARIMTCNKSLIFERLSVFWRFGMTFQEVYKKTWKIEKS